MENLIRYCLPGLLMLLLVTAGRAETQRVNLARGRPVTFATPPNYPLCTDDNDAVQLTDGEYCPDDSALWGHKNAVGWAGASPVVLTIDLGESQPISGVSYSTGAGFAGVSWPTSILILVGEDRKTWRVAGDLVRLAEAEPPPLGDYHKFTYVTHKLATRGRYVQLAIDCQTGGYVFTDEVEVYAGPESLLTVEPTGEVVRDAREYVKSIRVTERVRDRVEADIAFVERAVVESDLDTWAKDLLSRRLAEARRKTETMKTITSADFQAVLPVNEVHTEVFRAFAHVIRAKGLPQFFAWKKYRYEPLGHFEAPAKAPKSVQLSITMMRNEFRSDSFLLTNASDKPVSVPLRIQGLPGSRRPGWLEVSSVPWTDTSSQIPIAAALPEARYSGGAYHIDIPSGMTRKIWLTVDSSKLKAGSYNLTVLADLPTGAIRIPLKLRVSALAMRKPGLSLGMWDYTDANARDINDGNRMAVIKLMRSHFVDSPWAGAGSLPWPKAEDFDSVNRLKSPLSFDVMDRWVKLWPGAKYYLVFANVSDDFAGAKAGSEEFHQRVGAWAKAVDDHRKKLGIKPGRLALLLVDEPALDSLDLRIIAWARAIKEYAPGIGIFADPSWDRPDLTANQDAILKADILCPNLSTLLRAPREVSDYYAGLRGKGKALWFYQCNGPTKLLSPDRYFRLQAWYAFTYGATGMAFWSFGDAGGCVSSWNEYTCSGPSYTPAFLARDGATDGIHWQATREGVEDYEYMAMLRDAAAKSTDQTFKNKAIALLAEIGRKVTPDRQPLAKWSGDADRSGMDVYRLKVLGLLESEECR